jgi:hypothetical protein
MSVCYESRTFWQAGAGPQDSRTLNIPDALPDFEVFDDDTNVP